MKTKKKMFSSADELKQLIAQYFIYIEGKAIKKRKTEKGTDGKIKRSTTTTWEREPEPAAIAGLAFSLGFNSRQEFEDYEANGEYSALLKRAVLRIMADYEKKLHVTSSTGAIFALKSMGWNERTDNKASETALKVEIIQSGPQLASSEKEVVI